MPEDSLHRHEVHYAFERLLRTDRNLDGKRRSAEHFLHLTHNLEKVGARTVHLVHISDAGYVIFVGLTPNGLTLGLHTADCAESGNGAVEHTQRTLHLYGEVNVPRGVDQVDLEFVVVIFPERRCGGGGDCDSALLLLLHPVHGGGSIVNLTDLMCQTGIEKDTFGCCGLSGIDVSHDADIAGKSKIVVFCHFLFSLC